MKLILVVVITFVLVPVAVPQTPADYDALIQSAAMQLRVGDAPVALSLSITAIKINPGRWEAHGLAARCLMALKRYSEAVKEFDLSAANAPEDQRGELRALRNQCVLAEMKPAEGLYGPQASHSPRTDELLGMRRAPGSVGTIPMDLLHSYVPIQVGSKLSMQVQAAEETKSFDTSVLFYRRTIDSEGGETFEIDTRGRGSDSYRFAKDGLWEDTDGESPLHLIALPIAEGSHWEQVIAERCRGCDTGLPEQESAREFRIVSLDNPCSPRPGVQYDRCLVIQEEEQIIRERGVPTPGAALFRTMRYYARGVGLVQEEVFKVTPSASTRTSVTTLIQVSIDENAARERRSLEDQLQKLHPSRWP